MHLRILLTLLLGALLTLAAPWSVADDDTAALALRHAEELLQQGDGEAARAVLQPLAEAGNAEAQLLLGVTCLFVTGDLETGRRWMLPLAEGGHTDAQVHMAVSYLGRGSAEWDRLGIDWLNKAAEGGSADAAEQLALGYRMGWWGLERDAEQAAAWQARASALRRAVPAEAVGQPH